MVAQPPPWRKAVPVGRAGLFLVSNASSDVSGQTLAVDRGWSAA